MPRGRKDDGLNHSTQNRSRRALHKDTERLAKFLGGKDKPFSVVLSPTLLIRRRGVSTTKIECDLFDERLAVSYTVTPVRKWKALRRYKKFTSVCLVPQSKSRLLNQFTVPPEKISAGECVLVKHEFSEPGEPDSYWKAKVLEVRALDTYHVFLRVAWLNRPEDLPTGRQPQHAADELFPSNEMDVIDATSVEGAIEVMHWDERGSGISSGSHRQRYYWRHTYNYISKQYSSTSLSDGRACTVA